MQKLKKIIKEMFSKKRTSDEIIHISYIKLQEMLRENIDTILLDVRSPQEYNEGHISNAICIPNETIDEEVMAKLPNKEQLILIYCRSGNRSKQAATKLEKLGYTNLIEFGGIIDWKGEIVK